MKVNKNFILFFDSRITPPPQRGQATKITNFPESSSVFYRISNNFYLEYCQTTPKTDTLTVRKNLQTLAMHSIQDSYSNLSAKNLPALKIVFQLLNH